MSRCLRCGAGNEWIEGKTPDQLEHLDVLRRIVKRGLRLAQPGSLRLPGEFVDIFQHITDEIERLK